MRSHAEAFAGWRYPGGYATYDVARIVIRSQGYWAVSDGGALVGYCCFGSEARVPGVEEEAGTLDIGYGMHPDLVGQGHGREFVRTILAFALQEFRPSRLRLLVLTWNKRSRRVAEALGFEANGTVQSVEGEFHLLTRDA